MDFNRHLFLFRLEYLPNSVAIWIGVCPFSNRMLIFIPAFIKDSIADVEPKYYKNASLIELDDFENCLKIIQPTTFNCIMQLSHYGA